MSSVDTNDTLLQNAINNCNEIIQILKSSQNTMQSIYVNAGNDWNDSKYKQFGDIINECNVAIMKTLRELGGCLVPLGEMQQYIRDYEETNIINNNISFAGVMPETHNPNNVPDEFMVSLNDIINQTPINNGKWSGDRGNSIWKPNDDEVLRDIRFYGNGAEGIEYRNGYPDFTPIQIFESGLPINLFNRNDDYQFTDCNLELRDKLPCLPYLISYFDDTQLSAIGKGQTPIGYTWHHDIQSGRMQLVPTSIHRNCTHYGGRERWGGGTSAR